MQMNCRYDRQGSLGSGWPAPTGAAFRTVVGALSAVILLALSIFVYSPLHHDNPQSGAVCPFCHFQSLGFEPAHAEIRVDVPTAVVLIRAAVETPSYSQPVEHPRSGRAPPASLISA
jgi:hypothetical protein